MAQINQEMSMVTAIEMVKSVRGKDSLAEVLWTETCVSLCPGLLLMRTGMLASRL